MTFDLGWTPVLGEWSATWNESGTVFTVTHSTFAPDTTYMATVMAKDAFANPMEEPYTWSFTTEEGWEIYLPLVLRGS